MPHLEDIDPIEQGPVLVPANRWQKLFQKSKAHQERGDMASKADHAAFFKKLDDLMSQNEPDGDEEKKAFRKACAAKFKKYHEDWDEDPDERAAVMAKIREGEKSAKKSADDLTAAIETVKKSVALLDSATPDVMGAVTVLAPLAGVTPTHQLIAQLPPELRGQVEAIQKSAQANAAALEVMQKSIDAQAAEMRKRETVAKAAADFSHVPGTAEEIAELIMAVPADKLPTVTKVLGAVEGAMKKSALFVEQGSAAIAEASRQGAPTQGGSSAYEKVVELAQARVQKSAGKTSLAKAITEIFLEQPELYAQHDAERAAIDPSR